MKFFRFAFWAITLNLISLILFPISVSADSSNFSIKFDVSYKIHEDGRATINQNYELTNLTTSEYAAEYSVKLGNTQIEGLRAFDRTGILPAEIRPDGEGGKEVRIEFQDKVVGKGKSLKWSMVYETPQLAKKMGKLWYVNIPKPMDITPDSDYTVTVNVPPSFGRPVVSKPIASAIGNVWKKDEFTAKYLQLIYAPGQTGNFSQTFEFTITSHLSNPSVFPILTEVALPSDNSYQRVQLKSIIPQPDDVNVDTDGNWLAKFRLGGTEKLEVKIGGLALVSSKPVFSTNNMADNTLKSKSAFWTSSPEIEDLVRKQNSVRSIYTYLTNKYLLEPPKEFQKIKTAEEILKSENNKIGCTDFATVFISAVRRLGVPAKQVDGAIYDNSTGRISLHCWVTYYDANSASWLMIDPAFESITRSDHYTSLDFSRLILTIHGSDPKTPVSAIFRSNRSLDQDIQIKPTQVTPDFKNSPNARIRIDVPSRGTSGFPLKIHIFIDNPDFVIREGETIEISSRNLKLSEQKIQTGVLPPFANREYVIEASAVPLMSSSDDIITFTIQGEKKDYHIRIEPFFKSSPIVAIGGLTILGIISIIAQITRGVLLQKRKRRGDLRGEGQKPS